MEGLKYSSDVNVLGKKEQQNGIIAFWKFMFCLLIILTHVGQEMKTDCKIIFACGSIAVDFFFLVSGYLLGKKALRSDNVPNGELYKSTFKFIWKKIKNFFPYFLIIYIIAFPIYYIVEDYTKDRAINTIFDLLFLENVALPRSSILGLAWYISAMLICMNVLYPLIVKYRKNFVYIIAPTIVVILLGYLGHKYHRLSNPWLWDGLTYNSTIRAFLELTLGVILYELVEKIKVQNWTRLARALFTLIEVVGYTSIFFISNIKDAHIKYDFVMLLILCICVSISFSEQSLLLKSSNNKLFYFLQKVSLPLYLNQMWIITLINYLSLKIGSGYLNYYKECILVIAIDLAVSIVLYYMIKIVLPRIKCIKKLFIS